MQRTVASTTLRRGDTVLVRAGNDRGKQGRIVRVIPASARAIVDGLHLVTRHVKPSTRAPQGGRIEQPSAMHVSNLQLVCPSCNKPTRTTVKGTGSDRERICRLCQASVVQKAAK